MIVGQFVGSQAFAAVGATSSIYSLIIGFVWGITAGFSVPTAQNYGRKDLEKTRQTFGNAVLLAGILTFILTCSFVFGMPHLLRLMNIFLDLLLILPFDMGVLGAALATVVSQEISGILCFAYIWIKVPFLRLKKKDFILQQDIVIKELTMGLPIALQYVITSTGMLFIQTSLNLLGTMAVMAYTAAVKVVIFLEQGPIALGSAMATYCAQNKGAERYDRIRLGVRAAVKLMLAYYSAAGLLTVCFGKYSVYLFISDHPEAIIDNVDLFLKIVGVTVILLGGFLPPPSFSFYIKESCPNQTSINRKCFKSRFFTGFFMSSKIYSLSKQINLANFLE